MVHDSASEAVVTLHGVVNGKPFRVTRSCKARTPRDGGPRKAGGSGLVVEVDGQDVTLGTMQATQAVVDELFGCSYLPGGVFLTHRSVHRLLEATDKEFR